MGGAQLPMGTVTFLFSDIEESTALLRRVGDDAFASIRGIHRQLLREAVLAHEGTEIETTGDGFFIAFESARNAVAAAVSGQLALAAFEWPTEGHVRVRMGLHTAEPHLSEEGYVGVGVHRAAIELLDLGEHRLKGLPREQRLFQLTVLALPSEFGPPRTADAPAPGVGTFLHTDLPGFRHVIKALGDEETAEIVSAYHGTVAAAVEANNGIVLERVGDHVTAVFRSAGDAIVAAAGVREALSDFAWPHECDVAVSIVVHSARWSGDPRRPAAGTAFSRLIRFGEIVEPGQILVTQATAALVEGDRRVAPLQSIGERAIPDFDEPVRLYELTDLK